MAVNRVRVNNNANVDDFNENERNSEDDDNDDADHHDYGGQETNIDSSSLFFYLA